MTLTLPKPENLLTTGTIRGKIPLQIVKYPIIAFFQTCLRSSRERDDHIFVDAALEFLIIILFSLFVTSREASVRGGSAFWTTCFCQLIAELISSPLGVYRLVEEVRSVIPS